MGTAAIRKHQVMKAASINKLDHVGRGQVKAWESLLKQAGQVRAECDVIWSNDSHSDVTWWSCR